MKIKHLMPIAILTTSVAATNAALVQISVGEAAAGADGAGTEVISSTTWNNIGTGSSSLFDSTGTALTISADSTAQSHFLHGGGSGGGVDDINATVLSQFAGGTADGGGQPLLTISGFAANQTVTNLTIHSGLSGPGGTQDLLVNGNTEATGVARGTFAQTNLGTFQANASGILTIGATSEFSAVSFDVTAVPEPSSTALLGLGGLALILRRRK